MVMLIVIHTWICFKQILFLSFLLARELIRTLFVQDGALPHWSRSARDWLNKVLPQRGIGRGGSQDSNIALTPRSPDLTSLHYFLCGIIRKKVYVKNVSVS